jgi:uncharacterized protein YjiS (DUF1127 family)
MVRVEFGKARCRFHGGLSTGPKTQAGRARIAEAQRRRWCLYTRHFFQRMKGQMTFRAQLSELSDWSLKDIGIFRRVLNLEAAVLDGLTAAH